jgi:hypothetical protein
MKRFYVALLCIAGVVFFNACNQNKPTGPTDQPADSGDWITSADQIDLSKKDDKNYKCWAIDLWCDGTTIGRQYEWGTEAQVGAIAKMLLVMDAQFAGEQTKKVKYTEAEANDADACHKKVWEGAECWEETMSAGGQSETSYGWMPEQNMKERHEYYQSKGVTHSYKRAAAADEEACDALNGEDNPGGNPDQPKDYSKFDNTTYKCWQVIQSAYGMDITNYVWMTERQLNEEFDKMGLQYTYSEADANDEDACNELKENSNPTEGEEACWKITSTVMGQTSVTYYWGTESEAQAQVNAINGKGVGTASYEKSNAADPDACDALDAE